ncbi:MAG: hypothetical protein HZA47_00995 [Planctomycetes bacterium]|uniref:hypothetical protein n=1 Tax=Candidatus Wunengus sp. YC65 TaxID=3367701 RepID=UPI001E13F888|nr:hypothetical protein [Planctomycetota bacterium]
MGLNKAHGRCPDAPGFSTSSLVFGPVPIHPREYYTPRLSKVKDILLIEMPTNDAKVRERDFVCFVFFVGKFTNFQQNPAI